MSDLYGLKVADYKFIPEPDITPFELALLLPLLVARDFDEKKLMRTIINRWPLPEICRHVQKANDGVKDDFYMALCVAMERYKIQEGEEHEP